MSSLLLSSRLFAAVSILLAAGSTALATGPDVITGDLNGINRWGRDATLGITAYSIGTDSCNIGTADVLWIAGTNEHPVIAQNMYRLKAGRFEQIGQSWLKHGFTALTESLCGSCNGHGGSVLGVGCSDPYGAGLNGDQGELGPRSEVNAATGTFPYPFGGQAAAVTIDKRLQVHDADLKPSLNPGAIYFGECQYVAHDDAAAGNKNNNASYRRCTLTENPTNQFNISLTASTERTKPAIMAWKDHGLGINTPDPDVLLYATDIPNDGRIWVASKATSLGGGIWHYEYAVQNLNSDRCAGSFSIPIPPGTTVTNIGFHDVDSHTGEPYALTDWTPVVAATAITWSTQPYTANPNANAIRWGTLYNFRFDADAAPVGSLASIGLFKPGVGSIVFGQVRAPAAADCNNNGIPDNQDVASGHSADCNANQFPDECELTNNDCDANGIPDECQLATDCNDNHIPDICDAVGHDCDANGIPDSCEPDCNANDIADPCDVPPIGAMADCDHNLQPDICQNDCDRNGVIDVCEIASGAQRDCNANSIPDNCDVTGISGGVQTLASGAVEIPIPDANPTGISHTISVTDSGNIEDVNVKLNISHTYDSDIAISLVHGSTTVILANHVGGAGHDFLNTTLDDQATTPIASGLAPFTGSYKPTQLLSAFNGANAAGGWTVHIVDTIGADSGVLHNWTLIVQTTTRPPTSADLNANGTPDECECPTCQGDMNGDSKLDGGDIQAFVAAYTGNFTRCADMLLNGPPLGAQDVTAFVNRLTTGAPCP